MTNAEKETIIRWDREERVQVLYTGQRASSIAITSGQRRPSSPRACPRSDPSDRQEPGAT